MTIKITVDRVDDLMKAIKSLTQDRVLVGVPADKGERQPGDEDEGPINNAALAYIHDNGAPEANIPARQFMIPGIENAKDAIASRLKAGAKNALLGKVDAADIALNRAGLIAQNSIRSKIDDGPFTPLAPATLANRRRRGRSGEKPLIDTAQMQRSITYVVRKK
ncbi:hypothetical protein OSH11_11700 [Kaistia dalseonensis]|uniref:Bacteriophage protein n=1 Tax=Kaistia dalseonensis TaxID=410840 RepID=A0ABU0H6M4_9HYPH|nr:hypothetical protein [Kaistia dalseonensis]MCX5495374.1 hypothetical protein [Kaistia dalseonensis]MDQ0437961.1 hypothetical protein [Kaistia dalseonensis]